MSRVRHSDHLRQLLARLVRGWQAFPLRYAERMPKSNLPDDHRRALELLAGTADGYTEASLMAHGLSSNLLAELIHAGLATVDTERSGGEPVEVQRIRITVAGWRALER